MLEAIERELEGTWEGIEGIKSGRARDLQNGGTGLIFILRGRERSRCMCKGPCNCAKNCYEAERGGMEGRERFGIRKSGGMGGW